MSGKTHTYTCTVTWIGNTGTRPSVTIAQGSDAAKARELHHPAHENC